MGFHVYIAGVEQVGTVLLDGFDIQQVLTQSIDNCSFQIKNTQPIEGQEVVVVDDILGNIFGGIIDQVKLVRDIPLNIYRVECQDYTYQMDQKLVVETYKAQAANLIAVDIISKYCPNFTVNNIEANAPRVEEIIFDYKRPSECLKELADYIGWDWYADYDRDIHFFNPLSTTDLAPLDVVGGSKIRNFRHNIDTAGLRNRVFVRGGTMLSNFYTHEIKADGAARTWTLPHKPHDITMTVNGSPVSVGIEFLHDEANFDYLMNYNEKYIRASVQTTTPTAGASIKWTYKYDIDVITTVEDFASQEAIAAIQGGDGAYEHVIVDDSLTTIEAAEAAGNADLKEHANPRVKGSFETYVAGWQPGQLVNINLPDRGVTGTFLVQKVTLTPLPGNDEWTHKIEYGGRLLGIADFLKALVSAQQQKKLNDTAILHKFIYGTDTVGVIDELFTTARELPYICGDADAICGLVVVSNG